MDQRGVGRVESSEDADLEALIVPPSAKFGGGALLLLGVLTLVLGLQTVLVVARYDSLTTPIIVIMFALGGTCSTLGFQITRGSGKATLTGTAVASVTFVLAGAWFVFGILHNLLSLLALLLMPIAVTALLFSVSSLGWARRADGARARLRAQGLDSGSMTLRADLAAALSRGVEAESVIAARAALAALDPLLTLVARRRLNRLIERANSQIFSDAEPAQRLRVARLLLEAPQRELDYDDREAVLQAYAELGARPGPERRGPWFTLGTVVTIALIATGGVFLRRSLRPFDPLETEPGRVLGEGLSSFVAKTSHGQTGAALAESRELVTGAVAERTLGSDTRNALSELLDASGWVAAAREAGAGAQESERFYNAANALAAVLRKRNFPYFVDADIISGRGFPVPLLMSFYIERESVFEASGVTVRALDLWRLDSLAVRYGALGYTRPRTPAALVLLDQVESDLVRSVLPALAPGEPSELVDDETREQKLPWALAIERVAGEAVRKHYLGLSADPHVVEVGKLLAKRRALVRRWRVTLADGGNLLHVPERLIPEADYAKDLHLRVANDELYEWDDLHDELLSRQNYAAFLRLRDQYVLAIERHEVEHRLDFAHGFRPVPASLCVLLGLENALDAPVGSIQERVTAEFSAYVAELSDSPDSPVLELIVLSGILLNTHSSGGVYWYAAIGLFEAVAQELGIDSEQVVGHGRLERERIAALVTQVIARSPDELRNAAAHAYEKAYGEPVPHVVKKSVSENRGWRH